MPCCAELQESLVSLLVLFCRRSLSAQDLVAYMGLLKGTQSAFVSVHSFVGAVLKNVEGS